MWDNIENENRTKYITQIARAAQTLPTTSAVVEQSFSQLKLVKKPARNRLSEETVQGLLIVKEI